MKEFVSDTDPGLRASWRPVNPPTIRLPALATLADWLDRRGDPRGPVVRIQARYWYVYYTQEGFERYYSAEADELQRRSDEISEGVYERWLGFRSNGDTVAVACQMPLLDLQISALDPVEQYVPKLREVLQAGWVWDLWCFGGRVDDVLTLLLPDTGPIRCIGFQGAAAAALRDGDLAALQQVPHLRELVLSGSRISDKGLRHLHSIRSLHRVQIEGTRVTPAGVTALQAALPACDVIGS